MKRVVKLGGSLLDLPDLSCRLQSLCLFDGDSTNYILVGGGGLVDAVRALDAIHRLDASFTHWFCVDLLSQTARYVSRLLELPLLQTPEELRASRRLESGNFVVDVNCFYTRDAAGALASGVLDPLPSTWETTSDAIAGLLAIQLEANELILLKSVSQPTGNVHDWAESGVVDSVLPSLASQISSIKIKNLRKLAHGQE